MSSRISSSVGALFAALLSFSLAGGVAPANAQPWNPGVCTVPGCSDALSVNGSAFVVVDETRELNGFTTSPTFSAPGVTVNVAVVLTDSGCASPSVCSASDYSDVVYSYNDAAGDPVIQATSDTEVAATLPPGNFTITYVGETGLVQDLTQYFYPPLPTAAPPVRHAQSFFKVTSIPFLARSPAPGSRVSCSAAVACSPGGASAAARPPPESDRRVKVRRGAGSSPPLCL